jgi:signal peptidase I
VNDQARAEPEKPKRSARHVKAAARILQKEARKILRRQQRRIAAEPAEAIRACVAAIDTHRATENIEVLEQEAERLDELLHQHASFARKSALRETLENIGIAVLIALGLRSCFYEPFKIPSGSMMPTLRKGDHIFVNKFVYGVQIPFTTTVIGESIGEIERGEVVVFRYPIDESEDFIKRVMGLPGDEIKVVGRSVSIKRAGEDAFELLERTPLDEPCRDEDNEHVVPGCQLFEERMGDHTYVVRYMATMEEREDLLPKARTWKVPEGYLLVMGDNRNQSHDSLQWTKKVEAVGADNLLTLKDLRDLTEDKLFTLTRPSETEGAGDPGHDHVVYTSNHRSEAHDISLAVWREPPLGARAVFDALAAQVRGGKAQTVADLVQGRAKPEGAERDRILEVGAEIDALVVGRDEDYRAIAYLEPSQTVLELRCGPRVCKHTGQLASRLTEAIARFEQNHEQDARELLVRPPGIRYTTHWTGRADLRDRFFERRFTTAKGQNHPRQVVRLQVFRNPKQDLDLLESAALLAAQSSKETATALPQLGDRAWMVEHDPGFVYVNVDEDREMVVVLECGSEVCKGKAAATRLASIVQDRVPNGASDRRKLKDLLTEDDLAGVTEVREGRPDRNPFDRVGFDATVQGKEHSVEVEVWLRPEQGLAARLAALQAEYGLQPDDSVDGSGLAAEEDGAFHFAFPAAASETVVRVRCRTGLCPTRADAVALARRVASKAMDPSNFIDPEAERPRPFVPRGNVKGRAERIWLPPPRFWLPIR